MSATRNGDGSRTLLGELAKALSAPADDEPDDRKDEDLKERGAERGAARRAVLRSRSETSGPPSPVTNHSHVRVTNGRSATPTPRGATRSARAAGTASRAAGPGVAAPPAGAPPAAPTSPATATNGHGAGQGAQGTRRRYRTSAGRCLALGLICFAIWLLFDANQLYINANTSPPGARRTVSMIILRPIAAFTNAIGISSVVHGANDALNKANGLGSQNGGQQNLNPTCDVGGVMVPCTGGYGANQSNIYAVMPPLPHHVRGLRLPPSPPPVRTHLPKLRPIAQPTDKHPLTMLDIGDSLGEDLGYGLGDQYVGDPWVNVIQKSQVATSLSVPNYYDWPVNLENFLHQYHPQVVVVMIGGNDNNGLVQDNHFVSFGTPQWQVDFAERVQQIMDEVTATGARVFWVGMPIMQDAGLSHDMIEENGVFAHVASITPGATFFSSWNLFAVHGQYNEFIPGPNGTTIDARYSDGTHIAPGGYDYLAQKLVRPMEQAWHIKLAPNF